MQFTRVQYGPDRVMEAKGDPEFTSWALREFHALLESIDQTRAKAAKREGEFQALTQAAESHKAALARSYSGGYVAGQVAAQNKLVKLRESNRMLRKQVEALAKLNGS